MTHPDPSPPHIAVLGAGPAGTGAAFRLAAHNQMRVSVFEAQDRVGGNAGSFFARWSVV